MAMCTAVTYTPYFISSKEKTGDIITFAQFREGNLLSETHNHAEIGDEYDDYSIIPPLLSEEEMDEMDSGNDSDDEPMSTETLEEICGGSKSHPNVNRRESRYKIHDRIKKRQPEWKVGLKSTRNMGKVLHKVFKTAVKEILQDLPSLG